MQTMNCQLYQLKKKKKIQLFSLYLLQFLLILITCNYFLIGIIFCLFFCNKFLCNYKITILDIKKKEFVINLSHALNNELNEELLLSSLH